MRVGKFASLMIRYRRIDRQYPSAVGRRASPYILNGKWLPSQHSAATGARAVRPTGWRAMTTGENGRFVRSHRAPKRSFAERPPGLHGLRSRNEARGGRHRVARVPVHCMQAHTAPYSATCRREEFLCRVAAVFHARGRGRSPSKPRDDRDGFFTNSTGIELSRCSQSVNQQQPWHAAVSMDRRDNEVRFIVVHGE